MITVRPDFTRKRGEDIDKRRYAGSTDASQLHIVVEGLSHFIIKQLRPTIKDLHLAGTSQRKCSQHLIPALVGVIGFISSHLVDCLARSPAY